MNQAKAVKGEPNVLFYTTVTHGPGERLQRVIEGLVPEEKTETYRAIESLTLRLRRPTYDLGIAVLLAASRDDLLDILSIRDLLCHLRIIFTAYDSFVDDPRLSMADGYAIKSVCLD